MKTLGAQCESAGCSVVQLQAVAAAGVPGVLTRETLLCFAKQRHAMAVAAAAAEQQAAGFGGVCSRVAEYASLHQQQLSMSTSAAVHAAAASQPSTASRTVEALRCVPQRTAQEPATVDGMSLQSRRCQIAVPAPPVAVNTQLQLSLVVQQQLLMGQAQQQQQQQLQQSYWLHQQQQLQQKQMHQSLPVQYRQQHTAAIPAWQHQWQLPVVAGDSARSTHSQSIRRKRKQGGDGKSSCRKGAGNPQQNKCQPVAADEQTQPLQQRQQQQQHVECAGDVMSTAAPVCNVDAAAADAVEGGAPDVTICPNWGQHRKRTVAARQKRQQGSSSSGSSALDQVVPAGMQLVSRMAGPHHIEHVYSYNNSGSKDSPSSSSMQIGPVSEDVQQLQPQHMPSEQQYNLCDHNRHRLQQLEHMQQQVAAGCTVCQLQPDNDVVTGAGALSAVQQQGCLLAGTAVAPGLAEAAVSDTRTAAAGATDDDASQESVGQLSAEHSTTVHSQDHEQHTQQFQQQEQQPKQRLTEKPLDPAAASEVVRHFDGCKGDVGHSSAPLAAAAADPNVRPWQQQQQGVLGAAGAQLKPQHSHGQQQYPCHQPLEHAAAVVAAATGVGMRLPTWGSSSQRSTRKSMGAANSNPMQGLAAEGHYLQQQQQQQQPQQHLCPAELVARTLGPTECEGPCAQEELHFAPVPVAAPAAEDCWAGGQVRHGKRSPRKAVSGNCGHLWRQADTMDHGSQHLAAALTADTTVRHSRKKQRIQPGNQSIPRAGTAAAAGDSQADTWSMHGKRTARNQRMLLGNVLGMLLDPAAGHPGAAVADATASHLAAEHRFSREWEQLLPVRAAEEFRLPAKWQRCNNSSYGTDQPDRLVEVVLKPAGGVSGSDVAVQLVVTIVAAAAASVPFKSPGRGKPVSSRTASRCIRPNKVLQQQEVLVLQPAAGQQEQLQQQPISSNSDPSSVADLQQHPQQQKGQQPVAFACQHPPSEQAPQQQRPSSPTPGGEAAEESKQQLQHHAELHPLELAEAVMVSGSAMKNAAAQPTGGAAANDQLAILLPRQPAATVGGAEIKMLSPDASNTAAANYAQQQGAATAAVGSSNKPTMQSATGQNRSAATAPAPAAAPALGVPAMLPNQFPMWHPWSAAATAAQQYSWGCMTSTAAQQHCWDPAAAAAAPAAMQCSRGCMGSIAMPQQHTSLASPAKGSPAGPAAAPSAGLQTQSPAHNTAAMSKRPPATAASRIKHQRRAVDPCPDVDAAARDAPQQQEQQPSPAAVAARSAWCWRWNAATRQYEPMYDRTESQQRRQRLIQALRSQQQQQQQASKRVPHLQQQQQQQAPARLRPLQQQVKLAEQRGQKERRMLQQLQRNQRQQEGYEYPRGPQTARQRQSQQQQNMHSMQCIHAQQVRPQLQQQASRLRSATPDSGSDSEELSAGWQQRTAAAAAAGAAHKAAAEGDSGGASSQPTADPSNYTVDIDPGQDLPAKDAQPGDYKRREPNSLWDAEEYELAAAAGAAQLGISLTPLGQDLGDGRDPCLVSDLAAAATRAAKRAAAGLPAAAVTAEVGVLVMAHEKGVSTTAAWEAWEQSHNGKVVVLVHMKQGVVVNSSVPGHEWLATRLLNSRVRSQWGDVSLTAGVMSAAAEMLQRCPNLQHTAVVSGQDVPVAALPLPLPAGVSMFGSFQFGRVYDAAAQHVAAAALHQQLGMSAAEARQWGDSLTFHHTWMILSRPLVLALLTKKQEILQVGKVLNARFMQPDAAVAADEFMLMTAAIRYGYSRVVIRSKLQNYIAAVRRQLKEQDLAMEFDQQTEQRRSKLLAALPGSGHSSEDEEQYASAEELFMAIQAGAAAAALRQQDAAEVASVSDSGHSGPVSRPTRRRVAVLLQQQGNNSSNSTTTTMAAAAALPPRYPSAPTAASGCSSQRGGQSGRQVTRSLAAMLKDKVAADEATRELAAESGDLHHGVLLDCCPTLALFHPTKTRHPHTWKNFSQVLECDLNALSEEDDNRLNLLQALGLVKPNQALFFRKVDIQRCHGGGGQSADEQLLTVLQLTWQGKPLPESVAALEAA